MFVETRRLVNGVQLNLARVATGEPSILFIHGVLRGWTDFLSILSPLQSRWSLSAVDLRGHGRSDRAPSQYLVMDYVRDMVALLDEAFFSPVVLYGHSLGAMVAARVAAERPDRVTGLVLEDPPFHTMGDRIQQTMFHSQFVGIQEILRSRVDLVTLAQRLADVQIVSPSDNRTFRLGDVRDAAALRYSARCLLDLDPTVLDPIVAGRWLDGYEFPQFLSSVRAPTLVLQGNLDKGAMLTDDDVRTLQSELPDCSVIRFTSVGHLIHSQAAETLQQVLLPFLESCRN